MNSLKNTENQLNDTRPTQASTTLSVPTNTSPSTTPFWKLSSGKNGEKYLIFPSTIRRNSNYLSDSLGADTTTAASTTMRTYKMRWFILIVICLVNLSNAINWIQFSPIADFASKFYNVDYAYINYLSLVYMVVALPAGLASFFLIDYFGVRFSINFSAWLNFIGAIVRVLSSIDEADGTSIVPKSSKYPVLMTGQFLCAFAQPFIMFITTKFANSWFPQDQRALANTVALSSNTFGILIGAFISPLIVDNALTFVSEMCFLNLITAGISLPAVVLAGFIGSSLPPTPPSIGASKNNTDTIEIQTFSQKSHYVLEHIGKLAKSVNFLILCLCFGLGLGLFSALTTLIEQITCVRGYTDDDAGIFGGVLIFSGIIGSLVFGLIVDKTKKFEEVSKICFCSSTVANILFVILQQYNNDNGLLKYAMMFSFIMTGFFGLSLLPVCMEMSVECIYPIPEDIPTGILFMTGQVFGIIMVLSYPYLGTTIQKDTTIYDSIQQCTASTANSTTNTNLTVVDYNNPLYAQTCLFVLISILFTIFFKCPYLRLHSERVKLTEEILNSTRQTNLP